MSIINRNFIKSVFASSVMALSLGACASPFHHGMNTNQSQFSLTSPDISPYKVFPQKNMLNMMGCTGENISPAFAWRGVPTGTKSLLLTMYDADADTGSGWWHWVVYNIPASTMGINAGTIPAGALVGKGDGGVASYGGPCPPVGQVHRYVFTLHALKVDSLPVAADASPAMIGMMATANRLAKTSFTVRVGR